MCDKLKCNDCGWKGEEKELKVLEGTIIANCPEEYEVCPNCENAWLSFDKE